jgi:predicted TIM-barrel fold metal-dependent hydrolase
VTIERMISSDTHIIEPPDLWTERIDAALRDRAPRVVEERGEQWWVCEGQKGLSFAGGAQTGDRFDAPEELRTGARFEDVRPGGCDTRRCIEDNEADGIWGSVLYPTQGLLLYTQADTELLDSCCRAYNDWLVEFCSEDPGRLKGVAMLNLDDIDGAIAELERTRRAGLSGALIPTAAPPESRYDERRYERFWAAAQDLDTPLSLHLGANRVGATGVDKNLAKIRPTYFAVCDLWAKESIGDLIFSGVFDRYPRLKVGSVEHELGWIPFFLERLDYTYTQRHGNANYYRFETAELPSDFFHRNVFCSFQDDALGIRERHDIGIDGLMFGSDYPHTESTFPRSIEIMSKRLADVPSEEQNKIVFDNAAALYGFEA